MMHHGISLYVSKHVQWAYTITPRCGAPALLLAALLMPLARLGAGEAGGAAAGGAAAAIAAADAVATSAADGNRALLVVPKLLKL